MKRGTVSLLFTLSLVTLALSNFLAEQYSLYWIYSWLDIPMHMLGGVTVALGYTAFERRVRQLRLGTGFSGTLAFVLLVGIFWELFELFVGAPRESIYIIDTIADLCSDVAGGVLGYYIARTVARLDWMP